MKKIKLISILTMSCMGVASYANECTLDSFKSGKKGNLTFHCNQDMDLNTNPIYFDLTNNVYVVGIDGSDGRALFKLDGDLVKVQVNKNTFSSQGYVLPKDTSYTLYFDTLFSSKYELKNFRVGEESKAKGVISIKLPPKPSFIHSSELPTIDIYKNNAKVTQITDTDWNGIKTIDLDVGSSADIEVRIKTIDGSEGVAEPAKFTLTPGYTQKVKIKYEAPAVVTGSVDLVAETPDTTNIAPKFVIKNSDGKVVSEGNLNFTNPVHITNLPASEDGVKYTLEVEGYIENGFKYTPSFKSTIVITNAEPTNVTIAFDKESLPVQVDKVTFDISGLPEGKTTTLKLASSDSDYKEIKLDGNKTYTIEIPQDKSAYTIIASELDGYEVLIAPSNVFVADKESESFSINYTQKFKPLFELGLVSYDTRPKYGKIMFVSKPNIEREEITVNVDDLGKNNCAVRVLNNDIWQVLGFGNHEFKFIPDEKVWNGGVTLVSYDCVYAPNLTKDTIVRFDVTVNGVTKSISENVLAN